MTRALIFPLLGLLALSGCSEITVIRYNPATYKDGFVYPGTLPIVTAWPDGHRTFENVADYRHEWVLRETGLFGSTTLSPSFNPNGTLASVNSTVDKSAPLTALVGSLAGAAATAAPAMAARFPGSRTAEPQHLAPGFYQFDTRSDPPRLVGPITATQSKGS